MKRISDYSDKDKFDVTVEWGILNPGISDDEKTFILPELSRAQMTYYLTRLLNYVRGHPDKKFYVSDFGNPTINRTLAKFLLPLQDCENVTLPAWVWVEWAKLSEPEEPKTKLEELSQKLAQEKHEQTPQFDF